MGSMLCITSKDVLEHLVKQEGWEYTNIFCGGRKIKGMNPWFSSGINFFSTIVRLYRFTRGKCYDLLFPMISYYIGRLKGIPTLTFLDSDLDVVSNFPKY